MKTVPTLLLLLSISSTAFARETEYRLRDQRCFATATGKETAAGSIPPRTLNCFFSEYKTWELFSCVTVGDPSKAYTHSREPAQIGRPAGSWNDVGTRSQLVIDDSLEYIWTQTATNGETLIQIRCTGQAEKF